MLKKQDMPYLKKRIIMTMTYKFIAIDDENDEFGPARIIEHTITGEQTWPELVERFEEFLKGIGYIYDGHLEMVEDEPPSKKPDAWDEYTSRMS
jgi:hypothetical protein